MNSQFWSGKRVLVTGHTGFKGAWLCMWLKRMGADITGVSLPPVTTPNLFDLCGIEGGISSVFGDIRDFDFVLRVMRTSRPQIVLHLAAQALVRTSYDFPVDTYATNVLGTVHLLEAIRNVRDVRAAVIVTTDKCYENKEYDHPFTEMEPLGGHDPYSSSKACAELVTAAYRSSYFNANNSAAIASARAGNVIGGGDWSSDRIIPDLIRAFRAEVPARIRYPNAVRPWQHVLEPLGGYLQLAQALWNDRRAAGAWNFGPDVNSVRNVGWIADELTRRWGGNAGWQVDGGVHPHEAQTLRLDCTKASSQLGWSPNLTLDATLDSIVHWYKTFEVSPDAPARLCEIEIDAYCAGSLCQQF